MYGSPHKKSGLPGLSGTHKESPVRFVGAVLAGIAKVATVVGKAGLVAGKAVATVAPKVGMAIGKGAKAVGSAGKAVGTAVGKAGKAVGKGAKKVVEATKKGSQARMNISNTVKSVKGDVSKFAKTGTGRAVIGGAMGAKRAADKQIQEVDQSIYKSNSNSAATSFSNMKFGNKR